MNEPVQNLNWDPRKLPREIKEAIGLVNANFAQTEEFLQTAIAGSAGLDMEIGLAITLHMPMPLRFDVLRAVAEITINDVSVLDELDEHIAQYELAIKNRNAVAHNRWCVDPKTAEVFTSKFSARGTLRADLLPMPIKQILADAEFIYDVGMSFFVFLKLNKLLPATVKRPSRFHKMKAQRKKRGNLS